MKAFDVGGQEIKACMVIPFLGFTIYVSTFLKNSSIGVYKEGHEDQFFNSMEDVIEYIQKMEGEK